LLTVLLLLASSIASFFDRFLGICIHPSSMIQLNILKTLIVASRVLVSFQRCINIPFITFFLCFIWCSNFSRLLSVFIRWTICFFNYHLPYCHFYLFLNRIKYLITSRRIKNSSQPLPFRKIFCLNNYLFCFFTIMPSPFS
jgi:hypothetical protein